VNRSTPTSSSGASGSARGWGCTQDEVREHTRAVLTLVLGGGIAGGERDDVAAQLPQDLRALMGTR
jgi:uncharacterized protein (DUF2267 family)